MKRAFDSMGKNIKIKTLCNITLEKQTELTVKYRFSLGFSHARLCFSYLNFGQITSIASNLKQMHKHTHTVPVLFSFSGSKSYS